MLAGFNLVNPAQIHKILAVLSALLSGHISIGFLNKERKQTGREEMLFLHFLTTLLIQTTDSNYVLVHQNIKGLLLTVFWKIQ